TAENSIRSSTKRPVSRSYSYLFRLPLGISTMTLTVSISVPLRLLWGGAMAPPAPGPVAAFYAGRQPVDGTAVLARAEAATPSAHCTAVLARRRGRDPFSSLHRRPGAAPRPRPLLLHPWPVRSASAAAFPL